MRNRFDDQLEFLNVELIKMGALCEDAIETALNQFLPHKSPPENVIHDTKEIMSRVNEIEHEINQKEREIEALCMKLILQQQPVAKDLRIISSALKMISDMERIGDQALDIAEITRSLETDGITDQVHIKEMAEAVIKMVTTSVESFVKSNLELAQKVIGMDDFVDHLFVTVKRELTTLIKEENNNGEQALELIMTAKYLERIGDHAVNIAQWVIYSIDGTSF